MFVWLLKATFIVKLVQIENFFSSSECRTKPTSIYNLFPSSARNDRNVDENCSTNVDQNVLDQRRRARENQIRIIESKNRRTTRRSAAPTSCLLAQKKFANQQKNRIRMRDLGRPVKHYVNPYLHFWVYFLVFLSTVEARPKAMTLTEW